MFWEMPKRGAKFSLLESLQARRETELPTDENRGYAILEHEIGVGISDVSQRTHVLVAQPHFDGRVTV